MKTPKKKFKAVEKNAVDLPKDVKPDIEWEGEELGAVAEKPESQINFDQGTGQEVILRFFDFAVNHQTFKDHKPTAQELFNYHKRGMEAQMWSDGMKPYEAIEPRLLFAKDKSHYRFVIGCVPSLGNNTTVKSKKLSELLK